MAAMSQPEKYMTDGEQARALILAERRIHDVHHLHSLMEAQRPGVADYSTVWRYWVKPPMKKNIEVVAIMAKALNIAAKTAGVPELDMYDLLDLLSGGSADIRYFPQRRNHQRVPARPKPRKSPNRRKSASVAA